MKKSVIRDFYDIEYLVSMENFIELLFASLANISLIYNFKRNNDSKTASLPLEYKDIIRNIMYNEQEKILEFSKIIDIEKYYYKYDEWESEFTKKINEYLEKNNKVMVYNPEKNYMEIEYSTNEIKEVFTKYDIDILNIASYFAYSLLLPTYELNDEIITKTIK